ncbi:MAG: hypothetical protein EOM03_15280 [Clostridia bacterium]|nr:hypothetical protein [Clostridia bacterium]
MPKAQDFELSNEIETRLQSDEGMTVDEFINAIAEEVSEQIFIRIGQKAYARTQLRKRKARSVHIGHVRGRRAYRALSRLTPEQIKQTIIEDGTLVLALEKNISGAYWMLEKLHHDITSGQRLLNADEYRQIAQEEIKKALNQ